MRGLLDGAKVAFGGLAKQIRLHDVGQSDNFEPDITWTAPGAGALFSIGDTYNVV